MFEEKIHLAIDDFEKGIMVKALNNMRTEMLQDEIPTEDVDDLLLKTANAKASRFKVVEREGARWRKKNHLKQSEKEHSREVLSVVGKEK